MRPQSNPPLRRIRETHYHDAEGWVLECDRDCAYELTAGELGQVGWQGVPLLGSVYGRRDGFDVRRATVTRTYDNLIALSVSSGNPGQQYPLNVKLTPEAWRSLLPALMALAGEPHGHHWMARTICVHCGQRASGLDNEPCGVVGCALTPDADDDGERCTHTEEEARIGLCDHE
jgi:hypothetical protein